MCFSVILKMADYTVSICFKNGRIYIVYEIWNWIEYLKELSWKLNLW